MKNVIETRFEHAKLGRKTVDLANVAECVDDFMLFPGLHIKLENGIELFMTSRWKNRCP